MSPDILVTHGEFHAEPHVRVNDRVIVQLTENQPPLIVGVIHQNPQPFTLPANFVSDLRLDEISLSVYSHRSSRSTLYFVTFRRHSIHMCPTPWRLPHPSAFPEG